MIFGLRRVHAFSLVELTLALGVAAFCLLAVFGLIPVGVQINRNSTSQTAAKSIIALADRDLRATTPGQTSLLLFIPVPSDPTCPTCQNFVPPNFVPCSGGQTSSTSTIRYIDDRGQNNHFVSNGNWLYRLTATPLKNTNATSALGATYFHLKVTWPYSIDPCATTPSGSVETFAAFNKN